MRRTVIGIIFGFLAFAFFVYAEIEVPTQAKIKKSWVMPFYRTFNDGKILLQSISEGSSATPLSKSEIRVTDFETRIVRLGDQNQVQLTAKTPDCRFNIDTHSAYSTNTIEIYTATTNLYMKGKGYYCAQNAENLKTNSIIIISNNVETVWVREPAPNSKARSNRKKETYKILSDHLELLYESNLVIYSGNVRVIESAMRLNCDLLSMRLSTNRFTTNAFSTNSIEEIVANGHVIATSPAYGRATGDRAVYTYSDGDLRLVLTGNAFWTDGHRESQADQFTYEREKSLLNADGKVRLKIPDQAMSQTNLLASNSKPVEIKHYTDLFAEHVTFELPPTNGPLESILAEKDVVITNQFFHSQATASRAFYTRVSEQFVLSGNAICRLEGKGEISGQTLIFGVTNQSFSARGGALLKLNLNGTSLSQQFAPSEAKESSKKTRSQRFVLANSQNFDYQDQRAVFSGDVHAAFHQDTTMLGTLDCDKLILVFGTNNVSTHTSTNNHLEAISAIGNVKAWQPPTQSTLKRTITCKRIDATLWPQSDWFSTAKAEGGVFGEQVGLSNNIARFSAQTINASFAHLSNKVEHAVAQSNVWATQSQPGKSNITNTFFLGGQRAIYDASGTNEILTLTNSPWAIYSGKTNEAASTNQFKISKQQRFLVYNATNLIWNIKTKSPVLNGSTTIIPISEAQAARWLKTNNIPFLAETNSATQ